MDHNSTQEARVLRWLLSGRSIDKGDSMAMGIGELHMRIQHISTQFTMTWGNGQHCSLPNHTPHLGDCWRYFPIENIGVTKDGPRPVWHPDKGKHVSYAIYRLPNEYHDAMRQAGINRGWIVDNAPVISVESGGQLVIA